MLQTKETVLNNDFKCDCDSTKIVRVDTEESYASMDETSWRIVDTYYYCGDCGAMKKFIPNQN